MKITIQAIHFTATEELKDFIQERFNKLDQFFNRIQGGEVILKVKPENKGSNKFMEAQLIVPGQKLVASENAPTFEAATDLVVEKLRVQLKKYKGKLQEKV